MSYLLLRLVRTVKGNTPDRNFSILPDKNGTAGRALFRDGNFRFFSRPSFLHNPHHVRYDLACPFDNHGITDPDIQPFYLIPIVQGRTRNCDPTYPQRPQHSNGCNFAGPSHTRNYIQNFGYSLMGGEFVCNRPPGFPCLDTQSLLPPKVIHFYHCSVRFKREIFTASLYFPDRVDSLINAYRTPDNCRHRKTRLFKPLNKLPLA